MIHTGTGWDIHSLAEGRKLILGGIEIPSDKGCVGHSDGDALIHAIIDALFGAAGLEDIGSHFSDKDPAFKDICSLTLLEKTVQILKSEGWSIVNVDSTIILQSPKLGKYISQMKKKLSSSLAIPVSDIGIKAKTAEHLLGELGKAEAVEAQAAVLISRD